MKKLLITFSALLALAAVAGPASAGAVTIEAGGEALEAGDPIVAVSTNTVTSTVAGTLQCEEVELVGEVGTNPGSPATAIINEGRAEGGGAVPSDCDSSNPKVTGVTVTVGPVGPVEIGSGTASAAAAFTGVLHHEEAGNLTCNFSGTVGGVFALNSPLGLEIGPSGLTAAGATCPVKAGSIEGDFEVTSGGQAVSVS